MTSFESSRQKAITASFLREHNVDPQSFEYRVTPELRSHLYASLWNAILTSPSSALPTSAYLFPREAAPSVQHALEILENSDWKLSEAQKRAASLVKRGVRASTDKGKSVAGRTVGTSSAVEDTLGPEYGEDRRGMACGHVFKKGEAIYRCRDCALDDTCVQCVTCFKASDHEGHDIIFSIGSGGCCDCGDVEAWKRPVRCAYHDPDMAMSDEKEDEPADGEQGEEPGPSGYVAEESPEHNIQDGTVLEPHGKAREETSLKNDHVSLDTVLSRVPREVRSVLGLHLSKILTYALDTLEHAPTNTTLPSGPEAVEAIKKLPSLRFLRSDEPSGTRSTDDMETDDSPPNSPFSSPSIDAPPSSSPLFSVTLWNDERHSFSDVIETVTDATGMSQTAAKGVAERVDKHGREIIETSTEVRRLLLMARKMNQIDLAVSVRPAYDTFAEEVAGLLISFVHDLANSTLYIPSSSRQTAVHPLDRLHSNAAAMRSLIGQVLMEPWQNRISLSTHHMSTAFFNPVDIRKLDGLLLMDSKMWKSLRGICKSLYMILVGPREVKRVIALGFARVYPKIVEAFVLRDREPEHSVCFTTVQLFSVPSIAAELVSQGFLEKLIQILQAIFTGQLGSSPSGILQLPPKSPLRGQAMPQTMVRQQRAYHVFYDVRYLLAPEGTQIQLVQNLNHLACFLDLLGLFNSITPDRRQATAHVEWESEVWIHVFQVSAHVARTAKLFGEAFTHANPRQLQAALSLALRRTLLNCLTLHQNDPSSQASVTFRKAVFNRTPYQIINFAVDRDGVSFHHPMAWLLAEMLKRISTISKEDLRTADCKTLSELISTNLDEDSLLVILDFPLRVCVKLAQVRSGLWVRNGFGLRTQALHYRDSTMRDIMYDQDLFLLQCGFAIVNADRFLVTIAERFSLLRWFEGSTHHDVYDKNRTYDMVEECLVLLITLLSETSNAAAWDMEKQVRREIIHFLALNQGTYSEVTKHISEKYTSDSCFERVLMQVANFRAPDGTTDLGIYELKDECYDEIQPYFFHYNRNQRERAEEVLRERQRKKQQERGQQSNDQGTLVALPSKVLDANKGPFLEALASVFECRVLQHILFYSLYNVLSNHGEMQTETTDLPDSVVEAALQIVMKGVTERSHVFTRQMVFHIFDVSTNFGIPHQPCLFTLLWHLESHSKFKPFKPKLSWIIQQCVSVSDSDNVISQALEACRSTVSTTPTSDAKPEDAKRAAARSRQAAIMQQFSMQQKNLLETLGDEDDEDQDDGEDEHMVDEGNVDMAKNKKITSFGDCILCQEELNHHKAFGNLAFIQSSRVMRVTARHNPAAVQQALEVPLTLDRDNPNGKRVTDAYKPQTSSSSAFPAEDHRFGFHASTCGHMMHLGCFHSYYRSIENRHAHQIARNQPEDLSKHQFLCPLCRTLGNVLLPITSTSDTNMFSTKSDSTPLSEWIRRVNIDILKTSTVYTSQTELIQDCEYGTGSFIPWYISDHKVGSPNTAEPELDASTVEMLEGLFAVMRNLVHDTRAFRTQLQSRSITAPVGRKAYLPDELVAYTISMLEIAQRGMTPRHTSDSSSPMAVSIVNSLNDATLQLLRSLLLYLRLLTRVGGIGEQRLGAMRQGLLKRLLPQWGSDDGVRSPLLIRNPLSILVEVSVIVPEYQHHVTVLMYYATLVQVIFGLAQPNETSFGGFNPTGASRSGYNGLNSQNVTQEEASLLREIFPDVRWTVTSIIGFVGYSRGNMSLGIDSIDEVSLAKLLCTYTLPFLRRAAMLQTVAGIQLSSSSSSSANINSQHYENFEYWRLMKMLQIPLPAEALPAKSERQTAIGGMVEGWIKHAYIQLTSLFRPLPIQPPPAGNTLGSLASYFRPENTPPSLELEHPHIYELVHLPHDLASLLQEGQRRTCKRCRQVPPDPALCLFCGDILCYQCFCCQEEGDERGECNRHMDSCGGSIGIYMQVKSNAVILLYEGKGTFTYPPYLDSHGEIDIGLRKGRPQFLHQQRYDELRRQWLNHSVGTSVARKIEAIMDQGGWETA